MAGPLTGPAHPSPSLAGAPGSLTLCPRGTEDVLITLRRVTAAGQVSLTASYALARTRDSVFSLAHADFGQCYVTRADSGCRLWIGNVSINIDPDQVVLIHDQLGTLIVA